MLLPAGAASAGGYTDRTPLPRDVTSTAPAAAAHSAVDSGTVFRTLFGLVVVVAVVYGLYWVLRTFGKSRRMRSDGRMDVVATTALAPNRALHLVRVGEELVLVGSAESGVSLIRLYEPGDTDRLGPLLGAGDGPAGDAGTFRASARGGPGGWSALLGELRRRTART